MRTDEHLHTIFSREPRWIYLLAQRPDPGPCAFRSEQFKSIARTCDGLIEPEDPALPLLVVEFQLAAGEDPYWRIVEEMVGAQRLAEGREVEGIIFFGRGVRDARTKPWDKVVTSYEFDSIMRAFSDRQPEHPLTHLMFPVIEESDDQLEGSGSAHYRALLEQQRRGEIRPDLAEVYVSLFWQRFRDKTKQEIDMILLPDISLDETVAGKEIKEMGRIEGRAEGKVEGRAEGKVEGLRKACLVLVRQKLQALPAGVEHSLSRLTNCQLEDLLVAVLNFNSLDDLTAWLASQDA